MCFTPCQQLRPYHGEGGYDRTQEWGVCVCVGGECGLLFSSQQGGEVSRGSVFEIRLQHAVTEISGNQNSMSRCVITNALVTGSKNMVGRCTTNYTRGH